MSTHASVPKRHAKIIVAFPSSVISKSENPLIASIRLATIARAASIFRVERLLIYLEAKSLDDRRSQVVARTILEYLATPQYLRKNLFEKSAELKYAGALPPLRIPSHTVPNRLHEVKPGDFREGAILGKAHGIKVDVGLGVPFDLTNMARVPKGRHLPVRILDAERRLAEPVTREQLPFYWCYEVEAPESTLSSVLRSSASSLKIATSRSGESVWKVLPNIARLLEGKEEVLLAFGSPSKGLSEILAEEKINLWQSFDLTLNAAVDQGVATIRTEEAILMSLAVLGDVIR